MSAEVYTDRDEQGRPEVVLEQRGPSGSVAVVLSPMEAIRAASRLFECGDALLGTRPPEAPAHLRLVVQHGRPVA